MPVVPRLDQPQVQESGIPRARFQETAPIESFGGGQSVQGVNQAIGGLANTGFELAQKAQKNANDVREQDAYVQTSAISSRLLSEAKLKKGKDAFGIMNEYSDQYDKETQSIEDGLTVAQQRTYRAIRAKTKLNFTNDIGGHMASEAQSFDDQTFKDALAATVTDAVDNHNDPDRLSDSLRQQDALIDNKAQREGLDDVSVDRIKRTSMSDTHTNIVERMLSEGKDLQAKQYFEANRDQFYGDDITKVNDKLKSGSIKGEAQRNADKFIATSDTAAEAYAKSAKITDVSVRDETDTRISHHYAIREAAIKADQDRAENTVAEKAKKTLDLNSLKLDPNWDKMSLRSQQATEQYVLNRASGADVKSNRQTVHNIEETIRGDYSAFMKINFASPEYSLTLSEADFKKYEGMQTATRNGDSSKLDGYKSDKEVVNSALSQAGIPITKLNKNEQAYYDKITDSINVEIARAAQNSGKKPTSEEVMAIAKKKLVRVTIEKGYISLFDETKLVGEIDYESIPQKTRDKIKSALEAEKEQVSEAAILRLYLRGLERGK